MTNIGKPNLNHLQQKLEWASEDRRITFDEAFALKKYVDAIDLPKEDKKAMKALIDAFDQSTNQKGFFKNGVDLITPKERSVLEGIAEKNPLASEMLYAFDLATADAPNPYKEPEEEDPASLQGIFDQRAAYEAEQAQKGRAQEQVSMFDDGDSPQETAEQPAEFVPGTETIPSQEAPVEKEESIPVVETEAVRQAEAPAQQVTFPSGDLQKELYQAIKAYPGNKASDADAQTIARVLSEAGQAMQMSDANIRKMLSLFAHESGGFDKSAQSNTGAKGLGQLTGPAIKQMENLVGEDSFYAPHKDKFVKPGGDRNDLEKNIWTSVAYMHHLMQELNTDDVSEAFVAYNVGPGGYKALSSLPTDAEKLAWISRNISGVSPEQKLREFKTYAGHVDTAHHALFA